MARTATEAINSYVSDMLALEQHIERAIRAQIGDFETEYPEVVTQLRIIRSTTEQHIASLKALAESREAGTGRLVADALKRAGSIAAGLGAAAVDLIRSEKLPKDLRDDFTALCLAAIGYVMLASTARTLEDPPVWEVAERHLKDYADAIMALHNTIPGAVVKFLEEEGLPVRTDVLPALVRSLEEIWRPTHAGVPS